MTSLDCLFCDYHNRDQHDIITEDELAYARWDNFPASEGHAEIVPKRHVESAFSLTDEEMLSVYGLMKATRQIIDSWYSPAGYTIGINEGQAAGRTIDHVHIHLIPRYEGDVPDPRGGIRTVLPSGMSNYK